MTSLAAQHNGIRPNPSQSRVNMNAFYKALVGSRGSQRDPLGSYHQSYTSRLRVFTFLLLYHSSFRIDNIFSHYPRSWVTGTTPPLTRDIKTNTASNNMRLPKALRRDRTRIHLPAIIIPHLKVLRRRLLTKIARFTMIRPQVLLPLTTTIKRTFLPRVFQVTRY